MINKIKKIIQENRSYHKASLRKLNELEWAHIYHDSIRGKKWLEELPLNIGRWAGNYPFFYFLNRIMTEAKPKKIIEFGLGESTKMINAFIEYHNNVDDYIIIEHDKKWKEQFLIKNKTNKVSDIRVCELVEKEYNSKTYKSYKGLSDVIQDKKFDFYLIDGPFGSTHYSRLDCLLCFNNISGLDQFIILLDDTQRKGEKETLNELKTRFDKKEMEYYSRSYSGVKSFTIIVSRDFRYILSL